MIILPEDKIVNQIYYLSEETGFNRQERTYLEARLKEGRIYSNEILAKLPYICREHPLANEWRLREASMKSLIKYFLPYKDLEILDLGCGNGWLSNQLAVNTENYLAALDVNKPELEQAVNVFSSNKRLRFIYGDVFENILPQKSFDAVIISSVIQYFEEPALLIERLFDLLNVDGEIHIVDSNFYRSYEIKDAKSRSELYYKNLGYPEMSQFYHHHGWNGLKKFRYEILNKSSLKFGKIMNRLFGIQNSPFPWIRIKQKNNYHNM